jgi:hypothetical protein
MGPEGLAAPTLALAERQVDIGQTDLALQPCCAPSRPDRRSRDGGHRHQNGIRLSPVMRSRSCWRIYGLGAKATKSTTPDSRLYIAPAIFTAPVVSSSAMTAL